MCSPAVPTLILSLMVKVFIDLLLGSRGKTFHINDRLIFEREKFAPHVLVSAAFYGGKGRLNFVDDKMKVDSAYYVGGLLPEFI